MSNVTATTCAQTNVQLYDQLCAAGWADEDLRSARAGYELAVELFAGRFRAMGKPFVAHLVGVASLLEHVGASPPAVMAGLVHSAYPLGDFGSGRQGPHPRHRERVRSAIGPEAERLVVRYARLEGDGGVSAIVARVKDGGALEEVERDLLLMELMNTLEEHHDFGMLYCRKEESPDKRDSRVARSVELADVLERPDLAQELRSAMNRVYDAERPVVLATDHRRSFTVGTTSRLHARVLRARANPGSALRSLQRKGISRLRIIAGRARR